ncbi:MAG: NAD(P)/FAD-dependent oxidoreductase [Dehalococcoidia bacterium]|nr:NAD(P)/FAD-dependent oxidoreductase [Dehalococcoidia bacterium]
MERLSCDVLVIGAGPAGSTAARVASQEGARVLLVERKAQIGTPVQCAGYVAKAVRWYVDLPSECVSQAVERLRTHLPDGSVHEAEMPGYLLDRGAMDRFLAKQAVKSGAKLLVHTTAQQVVGNPVKEKAASVAVGAIHEAPLEVRPESLFWQNSGAKPRSEVAPKDGMSGFSSGLLGVGLAAGARIAAPPQKGAQGTEVVVLRAGQEVLVDARVIIGADGPRSTVARWMGKAPLPVASAVQYEAPLRRQTDTAEVYFRPEFRGGYGWFFPAGDVARVGAAFDGEYSEGIKGLGRLMGELLQKARISDSIISHTAGPVPVGGPGVVRWGNVLLVGDAAGLTHPVTGAGIVNAIISGEIAGRAAARAALDSDLSALDEYEEELRTVLTPALERASEKRSLLELAWDLPPAELSEAIRGSWIAFDEYYRR